MWEHHGRDPYKYWTTEVRPLGCSCAGALARVARSQQEESAFTLSHHIQGVLNMTTYHLQ